MGRGLLCCPRSPTLPPVALRLTHAEFLRLGPSLAGDGRLHSRRSVERVADPLIWTACCQEGVDGYLMLPGLRESTDDTQPTPAGYVVCAVPWADADELEAEYRPPPPTAPPPLVVPDHVRAVARPPVIPVAEQAAAAPLRPFHPPRPPDDEADDAAWEAYRAKVQRARERHVEAQRQVQTHASILAEAQRRAGLAEQAQKALPPTLAPHVRFLGLRPDGTAAFLVRSPTFRAALRVQQPSILAALATVGVRASRIDTRVGAFPEDLLAERDTRDRPLGHRSAAALRASAADVEDDGLRQQLLRLADAIEGRKADPTS
mgnify:CR=1 FL=1